MSRNILLSALALTGILLLGCSKDKPYQIPYAQINLEININNPQYVNLNHPTGWCYNNGGLRGLILYRKDQYTINAYDRMSPYDLEHGCTLFVDSTEIYAVDTCSNSRFVLFDGSASSGPATRPLIQYQTTFNGTMLTITN